jgi:phosphoglycolate phosphatase-like HAD superfamily hydrolase
VTPRLSDSKLRERTAALVFDFDGTLVDSSDIKQRAYFAGISETVSAAESDIQDAYRAHGTLNRVPQLSNAFRDLAGRDPNEQELESMVSKYSSFVRAHRNEIRPFDGILEFLARYRPKYHLVVASNAPQGELSTACDAMGLSGFLDRVFGYPASKAHAIEVVRKDWALPRSRILYIGDRREDGIVAEHVGVPFCRFGPNELEDGTHIVRTINGLEQAVAANAP